MPCVLCRSNANVLNCALWLINSFRGRGRAVVYPGLPALAFPAWIWHMMNR